MIPSTTGVASRKSRSEKTEARAKAIGYLRDIYLQPGMTVYSILRHVGKSGMVRYLDFVIIKNGEPLRITWNAGLALEITYNRNHESLRIGGCNFDAGTNTVGHLAWKIFGNAEALTHRFI